ncbi:hypothetical protein CKAN_00768200 [Cinnamomum micranthum f. kanehirae]|uniref:Uncharacterized protein n=1 Tax=Cinnamomum micranthum f. kanehirae TaxID=337451 RepID=A0A3S3M8R8_9MAGN|nr:hypothetical protein CKAN_00768200 [Cinnamomum micranthum f. kanehirae]
MPELGSFLGFLEPLLHAINTITRHPTTTERGINQSTPSSGKKKKKNTTTWPLADPSLHSKHPQNQGGCYIIFVHCLVSLIEKEKEKKKNKREREG